MFSESLNRQRRILPLWGFMAGMLMLGCQPLTQALAPESAVPTPPQTSPATVSSQSGQRLPITAQVQFDDQVVDLEVAQTRPQQATGLMGRESLADNRGMLFPFNPPQSVSFWMKNVLIDLDMIFVNEGEVIYVQNSAPPCQSIPCPTYGPEGETIDQVIELRGGRAAELGVQVGDRISIEFRSPDP